MESTGIQYSCNVGTELRVAVYSLLGLFALSVVVEFSLTSIGLKGARVSPWLKTCVIQTCIRTPSLLHLLF